MLIADRYTEYAWYFSNPPKTAMNRSRIPIKIIAAIIQQYLTIKCDNCSMLS